MIKKKKKKEVLLDVFLTISILNSQKRDEIWLKLKEILTFPNNKTHF